MQINLGGGQVCVSQGLAHQEEVFGGPEQITGERMAQAMGAYPLDDPGLLGEAVNQVTKPSLADGFLPVQAGEEGVPGAGLPRPVGEPVFDQFQVLGGEPQGAVFPPFAVPDH